MKKYIVKYKNSGKIFSEYSSSREAAIDIMEFINGYNEGSGGDYISPFDFVLEEVECKEVNEVITDFESARNALGGKPNADVARLVKEINPKHIESLVALNRLFTIAEAWNKADGFVPDFSDCKQYKWFPWFEYNKYAAKFVCKSASFTCTYADATVGHKLCFKTSERAEQFGKQFVDIYNNVFL